LSKELAQAVIDHKTYARDAAIAKAKYQHERAKFKVAVRARGEAKSVAESEDVVDATDEAFLLHLAYLKADAAATAEALNIRSLIARLSWGQSMVASERELDRQHALTGRST